MALALDVYRGRGALRVAGLLGDLAAVVVEVKVERLCLLEVANAVVVLKLPARVGARKAAEVVECVVVDVVLGALVVQVDFFFAVELALVLVLDIRGESQFPQPLQFSLRIREAVLGRRDVVPGDRHFVCSILVLVDPRPVGVVSAYIHSNY